MSSDNPRVDLPLNYGDSITLYLEDRGYLSAEGELKQRCFLAEGDPISPPENFSECVFQVQPVKIYSAQKAFSKALQAYQIAHFDYRQPQAHLDALKCSELRRLQIRRDAEIRQNSTEFEQAIGRSVGFGAGVQLFHVASRKYLTITSELAEMDRCSSRITLDPEGSSSSGFMFIPATKTRTEGDPIRVGDTCRVRSVKFEGMHITPSKRFRYPAPNTNFEVSASAYETKWILSGFCSFLGPENDRFLQAGDILTFYHKEGEAFLFPDTAKNTIMLKPDDSTGDFSSSDGTVSQDRISNPNFLFEVELAPATEGGLIPWNAPCRLRHLVSGRYLANVSPPRLRRQSSDFSVFRDRDSAFQSRRQPPPSLGLVEGRSEESSLFILTPYFMRGGSIPVGALLRIRHIDGTFVSNRRPASSSRVRDRDRRLSTSKSMPILGRLMEEEEEEEQEEGEGEEDTTQGDTGSARTRGQGAGTGASLRIKCSPSNSSSSLLGPQDARNSMFLSAPDFTASTTPSSLPGTPSRGFATSPSSRVPDFPMDFESDIFNVTTTAITSSSPSSALASSCNPVENGADLGSGRSRNAHFQDSLGREETRSSGEGSAMGAHVHEDEPMSGDGIIITTSLLMDGHSTSRSLSPVREGHEGISTVEEENGSISRQLSQSGHKRSFSASADQAVELADLKETSVVIAEVPVQVL